MRRCRARSARDGGSAASGRDLDALFDPRSVAVVGVSADKSKWGYWFARDALKGAHRRQVFLVGRSGGELFGQPVHRSLAELPEAPELVILSVPASGLEQAVDESLAAGARAPGRDRGRARRAGSRGPGARGGDRRAGARRGRGARRAELPRRLRLREPSSTWRRTRCRAGRSGSSRRAATSRSRPGCCSPTSASASRGSSRSGTRPTWTRPSSSLRSPRTTRPA